MPVPSGLRRATINASLLGGESMSHTVYYRNESAGVAGYALQDHANQIQVAWTAALNTVYGGGTLAGNLVDTTVYRDVLLYDIDEVTGLTKDLAASSFGVTAKGTRAAALPTECALVATLDTGAPGRTRRGRIYLGGFAADILIPSTARLPGAATTTIAQAVAAFMVSSRDQSQDIDAYRAVVYSRTTSSTRPITRVSVGDVIDVQRRRGNRLLESRSTANLPG